MSTRRIRQLLKIMDVNDVVELEFEEPDFKIRLRKREDKVISAPVAVQSVPTAPTPETPPKDEKEYFEIKSPMVGTFYKAANPDSEPFVKEGSLVEPDTVVCIVEAMKVMNEIKANVSGKIVEILSDNTQPVEYGQVLFKVQVE
jgi:acetyl-CoA carboxylase biotin carboxyl carrier protein